MLIENDEDYRGVSLRTLVTDGAIYTRYRGNRHGELFDLTVDPVQRYNRWADSGAAALRGEMEGSDAGQDRRYPGAPRAPGGGRITSKGDS